MLASTAINSNFKLNLHCLRVASTIANRKQCTIACHINDAKRLRIEENSFRDALKPLEDNFRKAKVTTSNEYAFLGVKIAC